MRLSTSTRLTKSRHFRELPNETPGSLVESGMGNLFSVPGQKLCSRRNRMSHETRKQNSGNIGRKCLCSQSAYHLHYFITYRCLLSVQTLQISHPACAQSSILKQWLNFGACFLLLSFFALANAHHCQMVNYKNMCKKARA